MSSPISPIPQSSTLGFASAKAYDLHRPTYPPTSVNSFLQHLKIHNKTHAKIVEVASGTGKFTEALATRQEGYDVVAVEPHGEMRRRLAEKAGLRGKTDGKEGEEWVGSVDVREGRAEDMPVEDGWGDACVAAQAFHW